MTRTADTNNKLNPIGRETIAMIPRSPYAARSEERSMTRADDTDEKSPSGISPYEATT